MATETEPSATADARVVEKLATWLLETKLIAYTGHTSTRTNAKPKDLWIRFHRDTEVWWFEHFRYVTGPATSAGAKGPAYALFRDALPEALRLFRSRKESKPIDEIEQVVYIYRKHEALVGGQPAVRAIKGFDRLPTVDVPIDAGGDGGNGGDGGDGAGACELPVHRGDATDTAADGADAATLEPPEPVVIAATSETADTTDATVTAVPAKSAAVYKCSKCGQPKKGHVCLAKPKRASIAKAKGPRKRRTLARIMGP